MDSESRNREQENFWSGTFGDTYSQRNNGNLQIASNTFFFAKILDFVNPLPNSILEFGANIGLNLKALRNLLPEAHLSAVEINENAAKQLDSIGCEVYRGSFLDELLIKMHDLVLVKGVLIHQDPKNLDLAYQKIYDHSNKWIIIAEYFNPTPIALEYHGFNNKLFKRDFGGEFVLKFPDVKLVSSGFIYKKSNFPQDDINWFLFEKK